MLTECHSPKQKCLSIPICHPTINCCNCPTKCICITNCCPQTPLMTFPSDNCEEKNKNKLLSELSSSIPSSQYITTPSSQIFTNQFRNSTPDIIKLHSKLILISIFPEIVPMISLLIIFKIQMKMNIV